MDTKELVGKQFKVYQYTKFEGVATVKHVEQYWEDVGEVFAVVTFENDDNRKVVRFIKLIDEVCPTKPIEFKTRQELYQDWNSWQNMMEYALLNPTSKDAAMHAHEAGVNFQKAVAYTTQQLDKLLHYTYGE